MKEHPILFTAENVRAILCGSKTQTRRLVKPQPKGEIYRVSQGKDFCFYDDKAAKARIANDYFEAPLGQPGDRLWVRETFAAPWGFDYKFPGGESGILYRADNPDKFPDDGTWKPSIFMPRRASRINLEITGVGCERLQTISEADAMAEGVTWPDRNGNTHRPPIDTTGMTGQGAAVERYRILWDSINGPGSWAKNPFVFVYEFKKLCA